MVTVYHCIFQQIWQVRGVNEFAVVEAVSVITNTTTTMQQFSIYSTDILHVISKYLIHYLSVLPDQQFIDR